MKTSYSVYGSPAFEASIEENLKHIATTISQVIPDSQLVAIILGGGYGRGEGGVLCKTGKEYLYNDYDLFLICKNLSYLQKKQYNQQVLTASHKLSEEIGIDVDFGPIKNVSELEGMPFTLMWYELKAGHKVIFGPADILQALPDYDTTCFPANEAVNLMLNRSVGLLLAEQKTEILQTDEEAPEFIQRNLDKAIMACGDAFLILNKTFHFSYVKRVELLAAFKNHDLLKTHNFYGLYEKAIEAKLKPSGNFCRDKAQVEATIEEVKAVFCSFYTYLFSELSGITITTYQAYIQAVHKQQHSSQTLQQLIKNMLLNIKEVGFSSIFSPWLCLYPRYRLFLALPYFLFDWKVSTEYIVKVLGGVTDSSDQNTLFKQFYKLWQRFN